MIRMSAIKVAEAKPKGFGPFTSGLSCAALLGIYINMAGILLQ